ncbi:CAMK/CAMK1 protein kinase, variant 2 [Aphanomyces astaci]|uniref:CAMK/CAMK1 protein kinase, variant 2 n=1 Tax=Aphanomyces astaci TaxID=112090 RepID=W4G5J5_APHAT|nr:CAMK/CAMK1 protein kinase, variant 2 [Aphanomyces astaci]ETV74198.1 CAMK/CAMK1 protein kinase, variant 2 [Aphanomyces astaci]|eukprot:XP_009836304.1 CAMK/CAMK1 protein kinase, variant 2 [Aphanomyces astaci]
MGNAMSGRMDGVYGLSGDEKEAILRFEDAEIHLLREVFKGITQTTADNSVDKENFLKIFPMPGLLGERLFAVFDKNASNSITFNEFIGGLAILTKGSRNEKMKFIFDLYDVSDKGSISKREMTTMIHQFPQSAMILLKDMKMMPASNDNTHADFEQVDLDQLVEDAFVNHVKDKSERMTFDEFLAWCDSTPMISEFLMSILPVDEHQAATNSAVAAAKLDDSRLANPSREGASTETRLRPRRRNSYSPTRKEKTPLGRFQFSSSLNLKRDATRELLLQAKESTAAPTVLQAIENAIVEIDKLQPRQVTTTSSRIPRQSFASDICHDGYLWKKGTRLKQMKRRYYVLQGNFLYYYATKVDTKPKGVIFVSGRYVDVPSYPTMEKQGFFAFQLTADAGAVEETRFLYAKTTVDRDEWVAELQRASCKVSIDQFYALGRELGKGRFSHVREATHLVTNESFAVKVIDKTQLGITEKELLRTEIAILKLVKHPHIIHLKDVYENKHHIYIVTELLSGGELFNKIVGRSRYTEAVIDNPFRYFERSDWPIYIGISNRHETAVRKCGISAQDGHCPSRHQAREHSMRG